MIRIIPTILKRSDVLNQMVTALRGVWGTTKVNENTSYFLGQISLTLVRGDTIKNTSRTSAFLILLEGAELRGYKLEANETKTITAGIGLMISET